MGLRATGTGTGQATVVATHGAKLKLVLRCVRKLSVGHIQNGHTDFLPQHVCGRLWWGLWLGVKTCLNQLIDLLDIKYPSSSLFNTSFVDYWIVCIEFIGLVFINLRSVSILSVGNIQTGHTDLLWTQFCGRPGWWWLLCDYMCCHKHIDWIQVNHPKFLLLVVVCISFRGGIRYTQSTLHKDWFTNIRGKISSLHLCR